MQRLDTLSSPRLLLLGGSNVAFGLDSRTIGDSLKLNVQNVALHAGNGLRFTLEETLNRTKIGDIIVIMPEYQQFFGEYNGDSNTLPTTVYYSGEDAWKSLAPQQYLTVIAGLPYQIKSNFLSRRKGKFEEWEYASYNFNEFGDEEAHWKFLSPKPNDNTPKITNSLKTEDIEDFIKLKKRIDDKGATVLLFWPINSQTGYEINKEKIKELQTEFENEGIFFYNSPEYFIEPDSLQFDGGYHMNGLGVKESTRRFISLMKNLGY